MNLFADLNLPNRITIIRILLIPIIILLLVLKTEISYLIAIILFLIASFTDFIDGYIARKNNEITDLGKILDPMADKLLVYMIIVTLLYNREIALILCLLLLSRDLSIGALRDFASSKNIIIAADWYGKSKTTLQIIGVVLILANSSSIDIPYLYEFGTASLWIAAAVGWFSFYIYYVKYLKSPIKKTIEEDYEDDNDKDTKSK